MPQAMKNDQIDLPITPEARETIETAAMISGQSLVDFVVDASIERAREVIRKSDVITLSARDYARVLAAIDSPHEPSPALKRAAERYGKMFE
jgi:uncharacterized protein (DUF1778 family)